MLRSCTRARTHTHIHTHTHTHTHTHSWQEDALRPAHCRSRIVRALAFEPDSTSLLVTRFVAPTPLPPHLYELALRLNAAPDNGVVSPTEYMMLKVCVCVCVCARAL